MRLNRRRVSPRGLLGVVNQIALSVVASLIATTLLSGLRPDHPGPNIQPIVTDGGKFAARIDAGSNEAMDSDAPARRMAAVWAVAPHYSTALVDDQGWGALQAQATPTVSAVLAKPARVVRNVKRIATAVGGGSTPVRAAAPAPVDLPTLPAPEMVDRPDGLWTTAASATHTLVAAGGALLGHLLP